VKGAPLGARVIARLGKKRQHACHYSFHIMDPAFGHLPIKMSGHPPFGAGLTVAVSQRDELLAAIGADPIITSRHSLCSSSRMFTWIPSAHR
jgi:hypothetical protein